MCRHRAAAMATASLRELDPPMHHAPFPAGFPLRGESPRIMAEDSLTDRSAKQQLRKELAEQEPRYENGRPPYPSGGSVGNPPETEQKSS